MAKKQKDEDATASKTGLVMPLSTLILEKEPEKGAGGNKRNGVTEDMLAGVLKERTEKLNDAQGIMEMHPDLRLAREILIAQTMSPKDLSDTSLQLRIDKTVFKGTIKDETLDKITTHFRTIFDVESKMGEILGEALFDKGAWAYLFIPPSVIDEQIASMRDLSMEDITDMTKEGEFAFAESSAKAKLASLGISELTSSIAVTKEPYLCKEYRSRKRDVLSMESIGISPKSSNGRIKPEQMLKLKQRKRTEGYKNNPVCLKLPVDRVINIHEPSDPSKRIGHYILIDERGNIVSAAKDTDYAGELENKLKKALTDKTTEEYKVVQGFNIDMGSNPKKDAEVFLQAYIDGVEAPLREALVKNELVDGGIELKDYDAPYRLMLSRALSGKKTRVLFVPADYVSYLAFEYNAEGHGVSLLEKTKFYASLRAVLQMADMIGAINNSVPHTQLEVTLDEADNDPMGTIQTLMHELSRMTSMNFPVGSISPSDIITSIQKAAFQLKIDGGDKFPKTKIERQDIQRSATRTDSDLAEDVKRKLFAGIGVPVEAIDASMQGELATSIILGDLLAAKRAMERQKIYRAGIEEILTTYTYLSGDLIKIITDGIGKEIDDATADENQTGVSSFIDAMRISLPSADGTKIETQKEAFEDYASFIRDAVATTISDDMARGILGDTEATGDSLDEMREVFASALIRQWMRENNILPELNRIVDLDNDTNLVGEISDHYKAVFTNFAPIIKTLLKSANKFDKTFVDAKVPEEETEEGNPAGTPMTRDRGAAMPFDEEGNLDFSEQPEETVIEEPVVPEEVTPDEDDAGTAVPPEEEEEIEIPQV